MRNSGYHPNKNCEVAASKIAAFFALFAALLAACFFAFVK